jgi:hypothetical protein
MVSFLAAGRGMTGVVADKKQKNGERRSGREVMFFCLLRGAQHRS